MAELPLRVVVDTLLRNPIQMAHRWYPRVSFRRVAAASLTQVSPSNEPPATRMQRRQRARCELPREEPGPGEIPSVGSHRLRQGPRLERRDWWHDETRRARGELTAEVPVTVVAVVDPG